MGYIISATISRLIRRPTCGYDSKWKDLTIKAGYQRDHCTHCPLVVYFAISSWCKASHVSRSLFLDIQATISCVLAFSPYSTFSLASLIFSIFAHHRISRSWCCLRLYGAVLFRVRCPSGLFSLKTDKGSAVWSWTQWWCGCNMGGCNSRKHFNCYFETRPNFFF